MVLLLSGCASVFQSYPAQVGSVRGQLSAQNYTQAVATIKAHEAEANVQLAGVELGRVQQLAGQYAQSANTYGKVIAQVRANALKAKIQLSQLLENTGSLMVNDRVLPYSLKSYEVIFLYLYQSLNYLAQQDLTDALVLVRQAQAEQAWVTQQHEKEIALADKKAKEEGWRFRPQDHAKYFQTTLTAAATVKSSFENALLYYYAAVLYQAQGDYNNAFLALKHALVLAPDNRYIRELLLAVLVMRGGSQVQIQTYLTQFDWSKPPKVPAHSGLVVLVAQQGFVPALKAVMVPIPLPRLGQIPLLAFPVYTEKELSPLPITLQVDHHREEAAPLLSVYHLAAKALAEAYPMIFVREALRAVAKATMAAQVNNKEGPVAGLLAGAYNILTAGADQRSWLTLPWHIAIWQHFLPAGKQMLHIRVGNQTYVEPLAIQPGKTILVWLDKIGQNSQVKIFPLN